MKHIWVLLGVMLNAGIAQADCISFGTGFEAQPSTKTLKNNKLNNKDQVSIGQNIGSNDCLTIKPEAPELYSAIAPKLPEKKVTPEVSVTVPGQAPEVPGNTPIKAAQLDIPKAITPPVLPTWKLRSGRMIGAELQEWAPREKCLSQGPKETWTVVWQVPKDWDVAANATFTGDFKTAAAQVIKSLAENGALVRANVHEGNCTFVVSGPGVAAK